MAATAATVATAATARVVAAVAARSRFSFVVGLPILARSLQQVDQDRSAITAKSASVVPLAALDRGQLPRRERLRLVVMAAQAALAALVAPAVPAALAAEAEMELEAQEARSA